MSGQVGGQPAESRTAAGCRVPDRVLLVSAASYRMDRHPAFATRQETWYTGQGQPACLRLTDRGAGVILGS